MTRTIVAALVVLVALALVTRITGTGPRHPTAETVYTAAQVRAGLRHNPRAWVGHTVLIRGLLAAATGASTTPSVPPIAVLIDVPPLPRGVSALQLRILIYDYSGIAAQPTTTLLLRPAPPNPLLALLRQIPVVTCLLPPSERSDGGEVRVYRVVLLPPRRSCPQKGLCYDGVLMGTASSAPLKSTRSAPMQG
jgi:hypothetical protein